MGTQDEPRRPPRTRAGRPHARFDGRRQARPPRRVGPHRRRTPRISAEPYRIAARRPRRATVSSAERRAETGGDPQAESLQRVRDAHPSHEPEPARSQPGKAVWQREEDQLHEGAGRTRSTRPARVGVMVCAGRYLARPSRHLPATAVGAGGMRMPGPETARRMATGATVAGTEGIRSATDTVRMSTTPRFVTCTIRAMSGRRSTVRPFTSRGTPLTWVSAPDSGTTGIRAMPTHPMATDMEGSVSITPTPTPGSYV